MLDRMGAAERDKLARDKRLRADARPIDPRLAPACYLLAGQRGRVYLDCYLRVFIYLEPVAARANEQVEMRVLDYRGRPAAEIYRIYRGPVLSLAPVGDLFCNRLDVICGEGLIIIGRIEIAVGTLPGAEWDMDVYARLFAHAMIIKNRSQKPEAGICCEYLAL